MRTFDTAHDEDTIAHVFRCNDFSETHFVVGPVYSDHVKQVVDSLGNQAMVIYPVYSKRQLGFNGSSVIKTTPDLTYYEDRIKQYINKNLNGDKLILVGDNSDHSKKNNERLKAYFKQHTNANVVTVNPQDEYLPAYKLNQHIEDYGHHWILINTDSSVITADVVNIIRSMDPNSIRLLSFKKSSSFDKVDFRILSKFNFTYSTNTLYFSDQLTIAFRERYKMRYGAYPSLDAIRGFDVVYDTAVRFLMDCKGRLPLSSRDDVPLGIESSPCPRFGQRVTRRVMHNFSYRRGMFQTLDNDQVYLVRYLPELALQVLND